VRVDLNLNNIVDGEDGDGNIGCHHGVKSFEIVQVQQGREVESARSIGDPKQRWHNNRCLMKNSYSSGYTEIKETAYADERALV